MGLEISREPNTQGNLSGLQDFVRNRLLVAKEEEGVN
jgi:hypothetical protein